LDFRIFCLRRVEVGARLLQLLIEVGRLDLGEYLAGLHARADVVFPALQVTADARINRCARIGFESPRQLERARIRAGCRRCDGNDRNRLGVGPFAQARVA
jgi:hypothetical protein